MIVFETAGFELKSSKSLISPSFYSFYAVILVSKETRSCLSSSKSAFAFFFLSFFFFFFPSSLSLDSSFGLLPTPANKAFAFSVFFVSIITLAGASYYGLYLLSVGLFKVSSSVF